MNYFELFEMPFSLKTDAVYVKKKFLELSRKFHPDFYTTSSEEEQEMALEKAALINRAYKIFSNTDETIFYFLQLNGNIGEEEKYQLSPDFLMEMMEINEAITDAKFENDQAKINELKYTILQQQKTIYEPIQEIIESNKDGFYSEEALLQIKEYYYQKKYLQRILDGLN